MCTTMVSCSSAADKQHCVHWEETDWVRMCPFHREATGLDRTAETGSGITQNRKTAFYSTTYGRNSILFIRRGLAYHKMKETYFTPTTYDRNMVQLIRRGVAYRKTEETNFSLTV